MVGTQVNIPVGVGMTLPEIERLVIEATLLRSGGNKAATARALGLFRRCNAACVIIGKQNASDSGG